MSARARRPPSSRARLARGNGPLPCARPRAPITHQLERGGPASRTALQNFEPQSTPDYANLSKAGQGWEVGRLAPYEPKDDPDKEFQERLLAALAKPKPNCFLAVVNSAFFLWLLSALFLSFIGASLTTRQQCLSEAEKVSTNYDHIHAELKTRLYAVNQIVQAAGDTGEIRQKLTNLPWTYDDLRHRSLAELRHEAFELLRQIERPARLPSLWEVGMPIVMWPVPPKFMSIVDGTLDTSVSNNDLGWLRWATPFQINLIVDPNLFSLFPKCSPRNLLPYATGTQEQLVTEQVLWGDAKGLPVPDHPSGAYEGHD